MKTLNTKYGKVELFKNNPREIRESSFNRLTESVRDFPHFMEVNSIVVWKVPDQIEVSEGEKCPFEGQEGKLICISGNQRMKSLMALGQKDIPDDWIREAKVDGEWWDWHDAELFVNLSNNPAGIAGDFDYEKLAEWFNRINLELAGIDFSEFLTTEDEKIKEALGDGKDGDGETPEDRLEKGENGEKSEDLQAFINEREKTRRDLKLIDETGMHLLCIFDNQENKAQFVAESGLCGKGGKVAGNGTNYVDLVFESSGQKMEFAEAAGLLCDDDEGDPRLMYGMFCDGRYIAEKMGISLKPSGLHFRDRKLDTRLAAMARDEAPQKTPQQIADEQMKKARAEREALGMSTGRGGGKRGKKDVDKESEGTGIYIADDEEAENAAEGM